MKRWSADSPLYGVVPVFGVFAVRVEEDVLIYSSTEAEHVWCRMFTRLQNLQHHSEGLFPVSRTVPPVHKHTHTILNITSLPTFIHYTIFLVRKLSLPLLRV